ncbi:hypothetical protein LOZ61_005393 [Ophidiomyces ophidiicola]|uniref:Uncharacterized protein n=1 Tax=Ophidiomyces ophidiicola TaxID=1387563 RepID=A0ACB8UQ54_9EURO|nr:hypothetical protein LOZ64_006201 [Ophidiomyces ophidiicola]KAI1908762.1 hypothetical protein LOZ61_005393 [Ophidiomyces ophidiicola]KAI1921225.1 hypothetical protein LOZ60_006267 [Ophidiomyces ophidiicola]KAI1949307.1 hypothetical protein LOZ59_006187 [Ophidiomyces ophidiicola]KAI1966467.1 hypothetical protein LOZ56_005711 [Ophidiomyces ophidiicola]
MGDMSRADKNSSNSTGTPSSDNEQKNNDKPSANVPEELTTITKSKARRLKRRAAIQQLNMGDDEPPKRGGEPDIELMRHVKKSWFRSNGYGSSSTGPFTIPRGYPGSVSADPSANIPEGHHPDNPPRASDETGGKTKRTRKKKGKGKGKGKEGTGMQQEINHGIFRLEQRNALIEGYSFLRDDKSPGPFSDSNKRSASAPPRIIGFDILKDGSEETPEKMPAGMSEESGEVWKDMPKEVPKEVPENMPEKPCDKMAGGTAKGTSDGTSKGTSEETSKGASEETSKGISEEVCKLPEEVSERMPEEIREHCEQTTFESHGIVFGHCSPVLRNAVPLLEGSLLPELLSSLAVPTRDIGRHAPFAQVVPEQSVIYPPPHFAPALPQQNYQYSHLHGHQNGYYYPYYQGPYLSSWHAPYHSLSRDPS